ncbi:2-keto-3-deoxygluconate kinase [Roseovarius azorensis]|uniref:2-keto-3-deoxygluconate kinase n=1 Tax=Roseovarius azorensis TaxID=1287727 RepID=A0A1H7V0W1_9RHOB|nr:sugar kinase [Roseovarius azorensis]SEM02407.1 2-keto-3-deoxygluconate kinase [Roseovarius azorensis]
MAVDILCLGEPILEFNQQPDGRYLPGHGGDTSNCAIAAARQGARVGYLTHIGADAFGRSFMDLWRAEGVDTSTVREVEGGQTGIYFVTHGPEGHEFSYFRAGSAASRMTPADLPRAALEGARILHVSGISQAISESAADTVFAAMQIVRAAGGRVSYDSNLRLKLWPLARARAVIHAGMAMADIALPGLEDAELLTGLSDPDTIADFYLALGARIVALTLGPQGTLVATPEARKRVPGRPVQAVDATGAGDTFDGAFLARLVAGNDPFAAARYANAAAALAVQGYGAVAPMPRRAAVEAALAGA